MAFQAEKTDKGIKNDNGFCGKLQLGREEGRAEAREVGGGQTVEVNIMLS